MTPHWGWLPAPPDWPSSVSDVDSLPRRPEAELPGQSSGAGSADARAAVPGPTGNAPTRKSCRRPPPDAQPSRDSTQLASSGLRRQELAGAAFWKMSGGGNDFVVFDNREGWFPKGDPQVVAALCARGTGVGADAVLLLERAGSRDADFRMVYYNADGSAAPMCGNGALCIARFAREIGLVRGPAGVDGSETKGGEVAFETGAGRYRAELFADHPSRVRLSMREPTGIQISLPDIEQLGYGRVGFADTGTPHLVVLVSELAAVDVARQGAALRRHPLFEPHGLNVDFVQVLGRGELRLRTYERGVEAETLSCGTGATAAALLTCLWGLTAPPILVHPRGGFALTIGFEQLPADTFGHVSLEGDAQVVFEGRLARG